MSSILLSIRHEHCEKIYKGSKRFEYRKTLPSRPVDKVYFYESGKVGAITGSAKIIGKYHAPLDEAWAVTCCMSGIDESFYRLYYDKERCASVLSLDNVTIFPEAVALSAIGLPRAPQSFVYLDDASERILSGVDELPVPRERMRLFVAGTHGVGKTTFSTMVAGALGYEALSSSNLIREFKRIPPENKLINATEIQGNQDLLIFALRNTGWYQNGGILDGHFTLVNKDGNSTKIPSSTFRAMWGKTSAA